jgi:uncharacterized membrane protein YraQ (UPF0718 family)
MGKPLVVESPTPGSPVDASVTATNDPLSSPGYRAPGAPERTGWASGWSRSTLAALVGVALVFMWHSQVLELDRSLPFGRFGAGLETFSTVFLGIFVEAVPFLLLGVFVSSLIDRFVSDALLARLIPRASLLAAIVGGLLGLVFPVCDCGVIPVGRRLLSKGAPVPMAVAFMLAAPVLNPIVIASTWLAFGGASPLFWGRFALVLAVAIVVALVLAQHPRPRDLLVPLAIPAGMAEPPAEDAPREVPEREWPSFPVFGFLRVARKLGLDDMLDHASGEFFEMGRYLVVGAALGGALQTVVPRAALLSLGHHPVLSVLAMMLLAVLLSVCSTVDAFVALSLAGTFQAGAVLAFLCFGPMVDLKSTLMYTTTLRGRATVLLVILCGQLICMAAIFANLNLL